jgi:superfamily I DNA/RNA helicase
LGISGKKPEADAGPEYWRNRLPNLAADRLLEEAGKLFPLYDMLIVDEAQDLIDDCYLDVMDLLLKGGLAGGRWAMFGDFERQAIYSSDAGEGNGADLSRLANRAPIHTSFGLRINCRNAEPIANTVSVVCGLRPGYKRVLHEMEGAEVDPMFYGSPANQVSILRETVEALKRQFDPSEIVILSMHSDQTSCARFAAADCPGLFLEPIKEQRSAKSISYASVHAFKGLEAPAIVLTDIDNLDDGRSQSLLYVGMSRARVRLVILMNEGCRRSYDRILDRGLQLTRL